jgi:hypothetical protein
MHGTLQLDHLLLALRHREEEKVKIDLTDKLE